MKKTISIATRSAVLCAVLLGAVSIARTEEPLPAAYRAAKAALESGDAAKTVAILEPRLPEAKGEQRGAVLFTLGVALLKLDRPADAEQRLTEAKALFENQPKLAEIWALLGDARAAQSKPIDAAKAYDEAVRAGGATPDASAVRYASARGAELAA
ncbi:MAG: hypothetical protein ABMA01_20125, partial [Chthoniobacteraceae bacterium]